MKKVKTVVGSGISKDSKPRVVVASSGMRVAPRTHEPKGKVVVANTDMPNMNETKGKVVRVLY